MYRNEQESFVRAGDPVWSPATRCFERGDEPTNYMKGGEFLDWLLVGYYQLLKNDSSHWRQFVV
jgi:hypothetical protein